MVLLPGASIAINLHIDKNLILYISTHEQSIFIP